VLPLELCLSLLFLACCSNGAQEQMLSPLDRARQALEDDAIDKSLMVSTSKVQACCNGRLRS
jgi:hypothetical protein